MRITALARGGLAVYGGHYDPHQDAAIATVRDGESVAVFIAYPTAPSAMSTSASGISATTPAVSGNSATLTLSGLQDCGYLDVLATVGGAIRTVRIRAKSQAYAARYGDEVELI